MNLPADFPLNELEMYRALLGGVSDRVFFKDLQGRFIYVNQALCDNLRVATPSEVLGKTDFDFFTLEHAERARTDELAVLTSGQSVAGKIEHETIADQRVGWVSTTKIALRDAAGNIIGIAGISRDVTEAYNKEARLREYAGQLTDYRTQMDQELALAREVQTALLPSSQDLAQEASMGGRLKFAQRYLPMRSVGGDFFYLLPLDQNRIGLLICDVMGHGVHTSLITVMQRILVDDLKKFALEPDQFLQRMNQRLCAIFDRVHQPFFVTACYAVIDTSNGLTRLANAGHPWPIVIRAQNEVETWSEKPKNKSLSLGVGSDSIFEVTQLTLNVGDRLLFYTDGLLDLKAEGEQPIRESQLPEVLTSIAGLSSEPFLDQVIQSVCQIAGEKSFQDDVCLLLAERC